MVDIHIDTGTVIAPVDLAIWREGESIDLRLDVPTTIGSLVDQLARLLGLPMRTWDWQAIRRAELRRRQL